MTNNSTNGEDETTTRMVYTIEYSGVLEGHRSKYGLETGKAAGRRRAGTRTLEKSGDISIRIIGEATMPEWSRSGCILLDLDEFFAHLDENTTDVEWVDEEFQSQYEEWASRNEENNA